MRSPVPSAVELPAAPAEALVAAVARLLPGHGPFTFRPLGGGVSSDIWRIDGPRGVYCVKRALPRLKVAADWYVPVRRNTEEVKWLRFARAVVLEQVPNVVAADADAGIAILEFFDPAAWTQYKALLMRGGTRPAIGRELGELLARLHRASAARPALADEFDNADLFHALRLEPFFIATIERNPELRDVLTGLVEQQQAHRTALVHGDFSPKNVLVHQSRPPVLLDAECANWGDPAFDVAFMLCHLLLKAAHLQTLNHWLYETANRFKAAYERDAPESVDDRLALLVPALMLARLDGKSPVEYLTDAFVRKRLRASLLRSIEHPHPTGSDFMAAWQAEYFL